MEGHTIVCGDDPLGLRIIEQLRTAGREIAVVFSSAELQDAGIGNATALICADDDDALNLEIALLARQLNPDIRVVARLGNSVLREAVALGNGPGAILDVADLAAPSVVEACLSRTTHSISAAGTEFVVSGMSAPRSATLRELFGDLAPVAVLRGQNSPTHRVPRRAVPRAAGHPAQGAAPLGVIASIVELTTRNADFRREVHSRDDKPSTLSAFSLKISGNTAGSRSNASNSLRQRSIWTYG
jgi:hypothetical protein